MTCRLNVFRVSLVFKGDLKEKETEWKNLKAFHEAVFECSKTLDDFGRLASPNKSSSHYVGNNLKPGVQYT
jgi:hypothetical protein